jgi:hypothetical protein
MMFVFQCISSHTDIYLLPYCKLDIILKSLTRETSNFVAEITSSETLSSAKCQSKLSAAEGLTVSLRDIPLCLQIDTFKPRLMAASEKCFVGEREGEYSTLSLKGEIFCTLRRFKAKSKDSVAF